MIMLKFEELPHASKTIDLTSLKITQVKCGYDNCVVVLEVEDSEGRKALYVPYQANPELK